MANGYNIPAQTKINAKCDAQLVENVAADGGTRSGYIRDAIEAHNKRVKNRRTRAARKVALDEAEKATHRRRTRKNSTE